MIFVVGNGFFDNRNARRSLANFIRRVIASEPISIEFIRVAVVTSCGRHRVVVNLQQSHPSLSITVYKLILRIQSRCRRVHLGAALRTVRKEVMPQVRRRAAKLVVIMTNGDKPIADAVTANREARRLKKMGVMIKALAVKPGVIKRKRIKRLVSVPKYAHYAQTSSVKHLPNFFKFVHSHMSSPIVY